MDFGFSVRNLKEYQIKYRS